MLPSSLPTGLSDFRPWATLCLLCAQSQQGPPLPECFCGSLLPSGFSWALLTSLASSLASAHRTPLVDCPERIYLDKRGSSVIIPGKQELSHENWEVQSSQVFPEPLNVFCVLSSVDLCFDIPALPVCNLQPPVHLS